jgi:hypothetical protein
VFFPFISKGITMKALWQISANECLNELREIIYKEQIIKRPTKGERYSPIEINLEFFIEDMPSKFTNIDQLHLACKDPRYSTSILYIAEIKPSTNDWTVESSRCENTTKKFAQFCINLLNENYSELSPKEKADKLISIATNSYNEAKNS